MTDAITSDIRGIDLRIARTARRLSVTAVARAGGWTRPRVSNIEASDRPTAAARDRYFLALAAAEAERDGR
jgi:transcriptional regulator with XRE-family HTH domain